MKNFKNKCLQLALIVFSSISLFSSCKKDDDPSPEVNSTYVLTTTVQGSDMYSNATYAQQFKLTNASSTIDNSAATEVHATTAGWPFSDGVSMFYLHQQTATIGKWDLNTTGGLSKTGEMNFADLIYPGNPFFHSETVAFLGGPGLSKIAIFNPKTLIRTGFIDYTKFSKIGQVTNFPSAGGTVTSEVVAEMIVSGNYMYAAMFSNGQSPGGDVPATKTCEILVIDITKVDPNSSDNSSAIVKRISDSRGSYTGAWGSGLGSNFMLKDENNDVYMLCHNQWGGARSITGLPACVLRIKSGQTEFDQSYYFDVEKAATGTGNSVMAIEYAGNGKFFGLGMDPTAVNPDDPYSYYMDPIYRWYKFDLYAMSAQKVSDDLTKAKCTRAYFEGDYVYLPVSNKTEDYITKTNISTLESTKLFNTNGAPVIHKLKE